MGLDCTHGAWHGAYSAFNRLRSEICAACGGDWPNMLAENPMWTYDTEVVPMEHDEGMKLFLGHSDCGGELSPAECIRVAAFLDWVGPKLADYGSGHLPSPRAAAARFAEGCRLAASKSEPLGFH